MKKNTIEDIRKAIEDTKRNQERVEKNYSRMVAPLQSKIDAIQKLCNKATSPLSRKIDDLEESLRQKEKNNEARQFKEKVANLSTISTPEDFEVWSKLNLDGHGVGEVKKSTTLDNGITIISISDDYRFRSTYAFWNKKLVGFMTGNKPQHRADYVERHAWIGVPSIIRNVASWDEKQRKKGNEIQYKNESGKIAQYSTGIHQADFIKILEGKNPMKLTVISMNETNKKQLIQQG